MSHHAARLTERPRRDRHVESLRISTELSEYYVRNIVTPLQVIAVLNREKISFVLVGAHGIGGWLDEPRATQDVDVVVAERHVKKATQALLREYPHLQARDEEIVVRLWDRETEKVLIDLMKPRELYRATFKNTHTVTVGGQQYRIASLEMALAMRFAAMNSLNRPEAKKLKDAADFILMVEQNLQINHEQLARLGDLVYNGGGREICGMVAQMRAGEKLIL